MPDPETTQQRTGEFVEITLTLRARDAGYIEGVLHEGIKCNEDVLLRFTEAVSEAIADVSDA